MRKFLLYFFLAFTLAFSQGFEASGGALYVQDAGGTVDLTPLQGGYAFIHDSTITITNAGYGSKTITSYDTLNYDPNPSISSNSIVFANTGYIYNIVLSDGTTLRMGEANVDGDDGSSLALDVSGNGFHGTIANATLATLWNRSNAVEAPENQLGYNWHAIDGSNVLSLDVTATEDKSADSTYIPVPLVVGSTSLDAYGGTALYSGVIKRNAQVKEFAVPTFDGSAYVDFGAITALNALVADDFTIFMFTTAKGGAANQYLFDNGQISLYIDTDDSLVFDTGSDVISGGAAYATNTVKSIIAYRSATTMYLNINGTDITFITNSDDVSGTDKTTIGATIAGATPVLTDAIWRAGIYYGVLTSAERTAYHADGTIPDDALIIPMTDEGSQTVITGFQGTTKYEGTITDATFPDFWAGSVDHPSVSWNLQKGWDFKNLGSNSDFGNGATDWTGFNATISVAGEILKVTATSGTDAVAYQAITNGEVYTAIAKVRSDGGATPRLAIGGISTGYVEGTTSTDWQYLEVTAQADAAFVQAGQKTADIGSYVEFDYVKVNQGKQPADISGNIAGTTTPVSNPSGNWYNGGSTDSTTVIDWNPYDLKEVNDSYAAGSNNWGVTTYTYGDTLDGTYFRNTTATNKEHRFYIYDADGSTLLGKYLFPSTIGNKWRHWKTWKTWYTR